MLQDISANIGWCLSANKYAKNVDDKECQYEKKEDTTTHYIPFRTKRPEDSVKMYMDELNQAIKTGRCIDCVCVYIYEDYIEPIVYTLVDILDTCPHKKMINKCGGDTRRLHSERIQLLTGTGCFVPRLSTNYQNHRPMR
jgi:hypothetical protein